jgi:MFS family permease
MASEDNQFSNANADLEKQDSSNSSVNVRSPGSTSRPSHEKKHRRSGANGSGSSNNIENGTVDGHPKMELSQWDCYDKLGFSYPWWKKWLIISVIFAVQTSMNFNASFYASSITLYAKHFHITEQAARVGQMGFLVAYAFGCEFWAPFSEEFGRWPIMQLSLFFVNIWHIPCALAPNFGTIVICRILGGLSSAGGSVTLGMVADMWEPANQQWAVAFIVLSSVSGSVIAPVVGGFVATFLDWHWNFWIQLILGGFVQMMHFFVPETRCNILITREARRRRKNGEMVWSGDELKTTRMSFRWVLMVWMRPFIMFVREPIVLCLSLLSGFSDALIFTFLQSYTPVYKQWNFTTIATGLAFLP